MTEPEEWSDPPLFTVQDEPDEFVRPEPINEDNPIGARSMGDFLRPRKRTPKPVVQPKLKAKKPTPPYRQGMFVKPLEEMYTGAGMMLMPFDPVCSQAVIQQAGACAQAMDALAKENEVVRRVLTTMVTGSIWGQVIMAHAPIIAVIVMHHAGGTAAGVAEQAESFLKGQTAETE